jgi:hypothetical protein
VGNTFEAAWGLLSGLALAAAGYAIVWVLPGLDRSIPVLGPWDEQGLRLGLAALAALLLLGGVGLPRHVQDLLPSGFALEVAISAALALTLLQYTALGGGQPLWAVEHVVVHVLELLGLNPADVEGLRAEVHRHLAPRSPAAWLGDVESFRFVASNAALVLLAFATVTWTRYLARALQRPSWYWVR